MSFVEVSDCFNAFSMAESPVDFPLILELVDSFTP